ncbi:hypothetical protein SLS56_008405 [Neofusicoccum ribis]|uniref:Uncharacterized protein n=1 Tax=Neofusicoccum ribis TaxID=45134 RepID=A0ABR3SK67_9PEZI
MVYTGKPSRGCQTCKTRRIRKTPDSEQSALPLVSQTINTLQATETCIFPPDSSLLSAFFSLRGFSIPQSLHVSIENQATAFFFRNFVLPPQQAESARGFFDILVPYYNSTPEASPLHLATHAVSLSVLGNYPGRSQMMREAARFYGQALQRAQQALQDPTQAKSDETLLTIMLFVLYEAIRATNDSITAWAHHIDGAVTLAKLRGPQQLEKESSRKIFQALTNAMQRCKPVEEFPGIPGWAIQEENAANRLTVISMGLPALRSRVRALMNTSIQGDRKTEAWSLIAAAREVDESLNKWATSLSEHWAHRTIAYQAEMPSDPKTAERWIGPVHAYADVWTSHIWNDYRITRVFTLSIIMACCSAISPNSTDLSVKALLANAHFVTQGLIDDLCASVPFHMNFDLQNRAIEVGQDRECKPISYNLNYSSGKDKTAAEALGGFLLVWHVFVAANVECIPEPQRQWLQGRLLHIGHEFGLSPSQMLGMRERHILMHGDTPNLQAPNFSMDEATRRAENSELPPGVGAAYIPVFSRSEFRMQGRERVDEMMWNGPDIEEIRAPGQGQQTPMGRIIEQG